jgi:hypothetical protein
MGAELDFIWQTLKVDSGIPFEVPITYIIPRTSTAFLYGDSSLRACGRYSTTLRVWRYTSFPNDIVQQTFLNLSNNQEETFVSINCPEYVTIIINYCAAITAMLESLIFSDYHLVVLCIMDNISAKNWTLHTSKKSIIGPSLARFFCRLLIGSGIRINAKSISTTVSNKIAGIRFQRSRSLILLFLSIMASPNFNRTMRS